VGVAATDTSESVGGSRLRPAPVIAFRRPFTPPATASGSHPANAIAWLDVSSTAIDPGTGLGPKDGGNLILLATPNSPSFKAVLPGSQAVAFPSTTQGVAGGGGSNPSTSPPAATSPRTNPNSAAPALIGPNVAVSQGTIRPLSQAPSSGARGEFFSMADSGGSGGGGGGGQPLDKPPTILGSAGTQTVVQVSNNGVPEPGQFIFPNTVPIGTVVSLAVSGGGDGYTIVGSGWAGGMSYGSYTSGAPSDDANVPQNIGDVNSNGLTYVFIVDSKPRQYTVTDTVTYSNGAHGVATLKFTSVAPTGSMALEQLGTQMARTAGGGAGLQLNPGIIFSASVSTGDNTAGTFAFLQIATSVYESVTLGAETRHYANDFVYPNGDNFNGPLHDATPLMVSVTYHNRDEYLFGATLNESSWALGANDFLPVETGQAGRPDYQDLPGDALKAVPDSMTIRDKFSIYLMYKPQNGGVWIGLDRYDWQWSETGTKDPNTGAFSGPSSVQPDPVHIGAPTGADQFPTWVNTTINLEDEPNAFRPGP